jgi:hypothetical protein
MRVAPLRLSLEDSHCLKSVGCSAVFSLQAAAVVTLVASVVSTKVNPVGITKVFYALSFARWAQEAYVLANAKR